MRLRGIEGRLLLIVVLSTLAMLVASLAALRALDEIGEAAETVTRNEMPAVTAALRLARIGERLQRHGEGLMAAATSDALAKAQTAIVADIDAFTREAALLERTQIKPDTVSYISTELAFHLSTLRESLALRSTYSAALELRQTDMLAEEDKMRQLIGPSILAIEAITLGASATDLATYRTAVRSQTPLLSAERLTNRATAEFLLAANAGSAESVNESRHSYSRTVDQLKALHPALPAGLRAGFEDVVTAFSLQLGEAGGFALRERELSAWEAAQKALADSAEIAAQLKQAVDVQVITASRTMLDVTEQLRGTIVTTTRQFSLVGLAVILVAGAASYALVIHPLSRNLAAVTEAMTRLAGGEKETQVPGAERHDEIGDLARAFTVFKDNSVHMEKLDRQLTERSNLLLATFETMNDGFSVFDRDRRLVAWNPKYLSLYGFGEADVANAPIIDEINKVLEGQKVRAFLPNGEEMHLDALSHRRLVFSQRHELHFPSGQVLELRSNPIPQGGFATIHMDVTDQRNTEGQLAQAQKMEIVGQLTGGIAHDFNNVLAVIVGNLNILSREGRKDPIVLERSKRALSAADRAKGLVTRLLSFSRRQRLAPIEVNLNELIDGMSELLETSLGSGVTLRTKLASNLPNVRVDPNPFENALMNLVINGRDAMDGVGEIEIATIVTADGFVELTVGDTGKGISEDHLDRVMEPFFTTKPVGKGSGLGLSMVHGFIRQCGGEVSIESAREVGTQVTLRLPVADMPSETLDEQHRASYEDELPEACILIVDDDVDLLDVTADQLRQRGFAVVTAEDMRSALDLVREIPEIDLLYTDLAMPDGDEGIKLAEQARILRPDLPVLFTSGAPGEEAARLENLLRKPVREDVLVAAILKQLPAHNRRTSVSST